MKVLVTSIMGKVLFSLDNPDLVKYLQYRINNQLGFFISTNEGKILYTANPWDEPNPEKVIIEIKKKEAIKTLLEL